jgi:hypothetical protein
MDNKTKTAPAGITVATGIVGGPSTLDTRAIIKSY